MSARDKAIIYLPLDTDISVRCYTNAVRMQHVTIFFENGEICSMEGMGSSDDTLDLGSFTFHTASRSQDRRGYRAVVKIESDAGSADMFQGGFSVMRYNLRMAVAGDAHDCTSNDAVAAFSWRS